MTKIAPGTDRIHFPPRPWIDIGIHWRFSRLPIECRFLCFLPLLIGLLPRHHLHNFRELGRYGLRTGRRQTGTSVAKLDEFPHRRQRADHQ